MPVAFVNSASIGAGSGGAARTTEIVTGDAALAGAASVANPSADATVSAIAALLVDLLTFIASSILRLAFLLFVVV